MLGIIWFIGMRFAVFDICPKPPRKLLFMFNGVCAVWTLVDIAIGLFDEIELGILGDGAIEPDMVDVKFLYCNNDTN